MVNGETTAKPVLLGSGISVTLLDSVAGDFRGTQEKSIKCPSKLERILQIISFNIFISKM